MDIDYDINMDDFDSVDYIEYSDEYYPREVDSLDYSKYWGEVF